MKLFPTEFSYDEPRVEALRENSLRPWWDATDEAIVEVATAYLAQGCPDWGEKPWAKDKPTMCRFCGLPLAVRLYLQEFWGGRGLRPEEHLGLFKANLHYLLEVVRYKPHTLFCFNAGSFLAQLANPLPLQVEIVRLIAVQPSIRRLVIEARAELITPDSLRVLTDILHPAGKKLTVRVGVETQDDKLRTALGKGHPRPKLFAAAQAMRDAGVTSGGYAMLNPGPGLDPEWAREEARKTLDFILGDGEDELGMDETYFGSTSVAPSLPGQKTSLHAEWLAGQFNPINLWAFWKVLRDGVRKYGRRVHSLPMKDKPPHLAVSSAHVERGIPQSLEGAGGCDLEFHAILQSHREKVDGAILDRVPECSCRPDWAV